MNTTITFPPVPHASITPQHPGLLQRLRRLFFAVVGIDGASATQPRHALFETVMRDYDSMILKICYGYARNADELDDLHQDALANIWVGLPTFRADSSLKTWLYRVTLNTCVSTVRSRHRRPDTLSLDSVVEVADNSGQSRDIVRHLHDCIATLAPTDKAIVLMWLDEFSYDEIADTVGLNRNTVATRLRRAKQKLQKMVDEN